MSNKTLEKFCKLGKDASYHFAAEGSSEWKLGYPLQTEAQKMYDEADPEMKEEMRKIAGGFLWMLKV